MKANYVRFGLTLLVSLVVMWVLSMSMVDQWGHFYFNLSNFWMALIMVSAMGIIMMVSMRSMFENTRLNLALYAFFVVLFVGSLALGRSSALVGDDQFLKSMIPHHSRAILVCQESDITDPEIQALCGEIIETQREEITRMEQILQRR
ncbi:DUF305 domain-containing protein [Intrasporangium sp.]|uniref:DUF305 domain-containing protein n=1 Tax=Intrasporangium sp. TaxID=1925024 RepID=UPI00293970BC|nr:DUF305 domain-containing protein [Intrasporangium sp.]MDV3220613.1 DUF305 domain-containing protein [Intrasporangium sp.]